MKWNSLACFLVVLSSCSSPSPEKKVEEPRKTEYKLLEEHNKQRIKNNLKILVLDQDLCQYAKKHAEIMANKDYLFHSSMSKLAKVANNDNVGENIAWGQENEAEVVKDWMNSWGHRANILGKDYSRMGFGVAENHKGIKYWCVVFSN